MPIELGALPVDAPKFRWEPWDAGSKPGRTDEAIRAGDFIYVPGDYNRVEDVGGTEYTRLYISRFSALDPYSLDTTWNPAPSARVIGMCHDDVNGLLYMGGSFTTISGNTRTRLACYSTVLDPADPSLNARFSGFTGPNDVVNAVELDGNGFLWVGGNFGTVGGSTRVRLAKLDVSSTTVTVAGNPNISPVAVFGTQRNVEDLVWDPINDQMLVAFKNSVTFGGFTGKLFAMQTDGTINWAVNPLAASSQGFVFQVALDDINVYLAMNGSNWTYAFRLTDGVQRWTWHTDGNNQGVQTLGGYVYISHHGDWTAPTKDNGTANNTTPKSVGIVAVDQNGILQTDWRPELRYPPGDPYGTGVLKGFDIGKDELSGQLYISGDQGGAYDAASGDSINARRFCFFEGGPIDPPPPPDTFRLTVNIGGNGGGTVVSSPAGINSSTTAVFDFDEGEVVLLTATEDGDSDPVDWSGSGTGTAPRSITMSSDKSVTATFALTVGGSGYGGPGDGVPILLAGGDFLAGNGRPDLGRDGVAALLQPYFDQDDAIGFVTLGDHAYNDGAIAEFDGFDEDFGAMDRKNARDFLFPTPGSHDYGSWGTSGSAEVGMTGFDTYFEGLGLTVDNDDVANQFYRVDDIIDADGGTTSWRLLRINGVLARSGFAQTQGGQQDGLIIPMEPGSPQYAFIQETMQAAHDDGKFLVVASAHPRWTSPSPTNHTSESRIGPAWQLADAILPGRCVFISGHQHNYERFEPQTADGDVDTEVGHVQFVAGTAGNPTYSVDTPLANSAALNWDDAGLLELTLRDNGYGYRYVLNDGSVFDEGNVAMSTGGGGSGSSTLQTTFDNAAVADGDNLSVANSSGGGDALNDVVKTGTGVTIKYETTNPSQGTKCVQIVVPATTTETKRGYIEHFLTTASAYPDIMVRPYQAAWSVLMSGHREDGTKRWSVVVRKDGRVELRDRKNTTIATSDQKLVTAAWNRIAVKAVLGASQSQNILEMRLYGPDGNTITELITETNMNLGLVNAGLMDTYRVGLLNPSKNNRTLDIDMFRVQDSGYFGEVDPPTVEGWLFDASGPPGGGGPNGIISDPNVAGVYHTIWDVGGYRRSTPDSDRYEMRMKGNSHDSQRKTAALRAIDSGVETRLLLGGGFNPGGYSESLDGGDEWSLLTAVSGAWNAQSPSTPDTDFLPHIPRSTGLLVDYDGNTGLRYWGTFSEGVKRYPGTGSPVVIAMAPTPKWYIRNLWIDPQVSTTLYVATYNDSSGRGGVWRITGANTGTGKTPTRMTPVGIGQVNKIIFSEDSNRMYIVAGVDGVWRATRAGGFTDWVDIGGSRISKQAEWCGGDVYSNGSNDVLVIVCHDPVRVNASGDPGATSGNKYGNVYVCDAAQTGSSPTWNYVSDPGTAGFPGGGDADVNVNSLLTGVRFWKADDNSGNNILGRQACDVVDFAWGKLSSDGASKEGALVGAAGSAWLTRDNARTWQVTPDGCVIVSTMSVFQDQARPTYGWQTIQDWDAFFIKDITVEYPTWARTPNVQNYTTAYGGFGAPDGTVLLLEGDPPADDTNNGEVLRWGGSGSDPTWTQIGGWNRVTGDDTSVFDLPARRPLACTKVKLANGTGRWIVYLENSGIWWLNDGQTSWTQATGFPTFASGNFRQHDMWAPNAWWTSSNVNADGNVFLGVRDSANGGLWVSDDYGATWAKKVTDNGSSLYVAAARGQSSIVYLSGGSGVRRITNPATMSLNQAGRIQNITGFGGNTETIAFHNSGDLYVYCGPSDGVYPRIWQCPDPSTTLTTFDNKVDICDPEEGSAADDSGQAALQYVNNMVFQGDILAVACSGGGVVRGRPRA